MRRKWREELDRLDKCVTILEAAINALSEGTPAGTLARISALEEAGKPKCPTCGSTVACEQPDLRTRAGLPHDEPDRSVVPPEPRVVTEGCDEPTTAEEA